MSDNKPVFRLPPAVLAKREQLARDILLALASNRTHAVTVMQHPGIAVRMADDFFKALATMEKTL